MIEDCTSTAKWVSVDKLASSAYFIEIGALTNEWTRVCFALHAKYASMENIAISAISPVARWSATAIKWNATNQCFDDCFASVCNGWLMDWKWTSWNGDSIGNDWTW